MWLTDTSVKRPVFATVLNLLLIVFGVFAATTMSVREYPDIDAPVVSVDTEYVGASAAVVETQITQILENELAGIEGVRSLTSSSQDGRSRITVEFEANRDIDAGALWIPVAQTLEISLACQQMMQASTSVRHLQEFIC